MKLFGGSLLESADSFLHAGYISAYPRALEGSSYPLGADEGVSAVTTHQLDVVEALKLGSSSGQEAQAGDLLSSSISFFSSSNGIHLVLGALTVAGLALLLYLARRQLAQQLSQRVPLFATMGLLALVMGTANCNKSTGPPAEAPWEGVEVRAYEDPEQATLAILHGLVAPALANIDHKVETLAELQDEVALPTKEQSEGMAYALQTYGLDGYGREFALELEEKKDADEHTYWGYKVTSAGADGVLGTEDDMAAEAVQTVNDHWGYNSLRNAYFLVKKEEKVNVLFHRWDDKMFEYNDRDAAREITGTSLFDILPRENLNQNQLEAIEGAYDESAQGADHAPILLQTFAYKID